MHVVKLNKFHYIIYTMQTKIFSLRKAAEAHHKTKEYIKSFIKPGLSMIEIVNKIDKANLKNLSEYKEESGLAFPCGVSLNNCAAHYTPNYGDSTVLQENDIVKIDYGTHVNGYIIDDAFTIHFSKNNSTMSDSTTNNSLIEATKEATHAAIKAAGADVRLGDLGNIIQEVIESYEVEIKGKTKKLKPINNLCGHSLDKYKIHAGKSIPCIANTDINDKMCPGEIYAIETFATTGKGHVMEDSPISHYMLNANVNPTISNKKHKEFLDYINNKYKTLAFCRRWLDDDLPSKYLSSLLCLTQKNIIKSYPPMCDIDGSLTSQHEHTFIITDTGKEVFADDI
jgi:methionyl aminopeptidase